MKRGVIVTICILVAALAGLAQTKDPTILRTVVKGDAVELEWIPNTDVSDFSYSEIWYKFQYEASFTKIDDATSTDPLRYFYTHINSKASNRVVEYQIINYNINGDVFPSEIMATIYVEACYKHSVGIVLTWNDISNGSGAYEYYIFKDYGDGSFVFLTSTSALIYEDNVSPGFKNLRYKVHYKDISDPTHSVSNVCDPLSADNYQPITPSISSLVVGADKRITLTWDKSPTSSVIGYEIYTQRTVGTGWDLLEKIVDPDITTWTEPRRSDCTEVARFAVAAFNNCATGPDYPDSAKSNLSFFKPKYDKCGSSITLRWLSYSGKEMKIDRYELWVSEDNGATFYNNIEVPPTMDSCMFTDFKTGISTYQFKIHAVNEWSPTKTQIVASCIQEVEVVPSVKPEYAYFRHVSVDGSNIHLLLEVDPKVTSGEFLIERASSGNPTSYEVVKRIPATGTNTIETVDSTLSTDTYSYHYRMYTADSCKNLFPALNTPQSILLKAIQNRDQSAFLEWNAYDGYINGLDGYEVYRYVDGILDAEFFTTSTSYTDTDAVLQEDSRLIHYHVAAISATDAMHVIPDTSYSNKAELLYNEQDLVFIPNAFVPLGHNNIFRPVVSNKVNIAQYEFMIFNRWGERIYRTTTPGTGWDGLMNGTVAPSTGYGYFLKITTTEGDLIQRRGTVILLN